MRASWKARHATMTPMFATQTFDATGSDSPNNDVTSHVIRQTQATQQFTPTQAEGGGGGIVKISAHPCLLHVYCNHIKMSWNSDAKAPFNWLTGSSLDTYSTEVTLTQHADSQSSLLFTIGRDDTTKTREQVRKSKVRLPMEAISKRGGGTRISQSQSSEILRLKRRFVRDQDTTQLFFIKRELRLKQRQEVRSYDVITS